MSDGKDKMFHCSVQICAKRGGGKSSVAAAAYRACESIEDDRTGITHDFTHKGGHVYGEVMLCENAPKEYQDRALLWNAVEKIEKNSNARTAREVEVALPIELDMSDAGDLEKAKTLLRDYINENFVSKGMCADWNIHNPDEDNHNPHCHIMLTTRPFKENGEWGAKEKKGYKLDENGERIPIIDPATGEQKIGARNRKMWERELVDSTGWNKQELVEEWRASWADKVNKVLAEIGVEDRVDHRSYERQGKNIEPTIHEGISRKMEEKYSNNDTTVFISDRIEENKKIREINSEISSLEKMMLFKKLLRMLFDHWEEIKIWDKTTLTIALFLIGIPAILPEMSINTCSVSLLIFLVYIFLRSFICMENTDVRNTILKIVAYTVIAIGGCIAFIWYISWSFSRR